MKLTNQQIYETAKTLDSFNIQGLIPIRLGFFLQKNINIFTTASVEIEKARIQIAKRFGELDQTGNNYVIPSEILPKARQEIEDLFNLEQDLPIHIFKLDDFDGIELTYEQLSAIMFMIEE